jgi:hypothetical protein
LARKRKSRPLDDTDKGFGLVELGDEQVLIERVGDAEKTG